MGSCEGHTYDQPVDELLRAGGPLSVVIHRDVYEISPVARSEGRLVRRELRPGPMLKYTRRTKRTLAGCT